LLATSDLHMQLTAFDYVRDRPTRQGSLARLAGLIDAQRQEADLCLLLDNGDTFQGTPMGDYIAKAPQTMTNPMAEVINHLGYDALGLGNHDFDLGLDYLARTGAACHPPTICSNLRTRRLPHVKSSAMLERRVMTTDGNHRTVRIGILSVLPCQTAVWNRQNLGPSSEILAPLPTLRRRAKVLRRNGADLIVVLAHMGIAAFDEGDAPQNEVVAIAALTEIDAVIGGHTHLRFPGPDHAGLAGVDAEAGKIAGTPVVLPGHSGSDLGVIDLRMEHDDTTGRWRIASSSTRLLNADTGDPEAPDIVKLSNRAHRATRAFLAHPVAQTARPMHSYFALVQPSPVPSLIAAAKRHVICRAVIGTAVADLPLLAAASTPSTGGFEGPDNFVSIPKGRLLRRDIAGLNPYANRVWAVRATGAQIIDWLERSALIFNTLTPTATDQLLVNPQVPGFRYDTIFGLSYVIDPTRPPGFDLAGRKRRDASGRIDDVRWNGAPIDPGQAFLVATTDHRTGGGGFYRPVEENQIVLRTDVLVEDALLDYLEAPDCLAVRSAKPWRFKNDLGVSAILHTAPEALSFLPEIANLAPEACGMTEEGFARIRLHL
jgi:2',3'-cyclic-nucleotide 2'-phosphodiesterase/3'-nucleotidase